MPRPSSPWGQEKSDMGDFLGRSYIARGGDHLQIGEYRLGVYMGQGRLVAIVLVVLVMLAGSSIASVVLVVLSRTSIASVVLVMLARAAIASVVLSRTAMMLVEARAMVAVASVVARAMVVARSTGGVSPIYMVDVGAVLPADGAVEVVCVAVFAPLSGREVAAYLAVAALPSIGVDVAIAIDAVEVGEVDVEDAVAVARSDTQFGYHLVGNDRGFHSYVGQSLGRGGDDHDEGGYGC
jgi:hypothetical protein